MADTWDLTKIFKDEDAFLAALREVRERLTPALSALEGKLGNEKDLAAYLTKEKEAFVAFDHLFMFASLRSDLDKKAVKNAEDLTKVRLAESDFSSKTAFADPEILKLGKPYVDGFLRKHPEFAEFDFSFDKLFREASHILPSDQEKLISHFEPLRSAGSSLYSQLTVADYVPKKVTLSNGRKQEVSMSNWTNLVEKAASEEDRRKIFEGLYAYYDEHKNAYGEIYNAVLKAQLAEMKARGYASILEEHLYNNKIPTSVFLNLIDVASRNAAPLQKYYELRRKTLGLEKHRSYDRFIQLAHSDTKLTYGEAKALFYASIAKFPKDFQSKAQEATKEGYVDVYPALGKRSGAYSSGGSDIHPFILLNFESSVEDAFTLAHESGHSIHTLYAEESQPILKQDYTIFVAEIASTFNEHNLLDYLMAKGALSKNDRIFLLQKAIDNIVSTFYRQTLFAQYEYEISLLAEKDEPISYEVLSNEMVKLYKIYYGIDIAEEKVKPLVWAYIPHLFYTPFYVYQYATSFTASMLLYENVKARKPQAFEHYLDLLKSGGSDYPIAEVAHAGVDLTSKEPFLAVIRRLDELVNELSELLKA
jgi:oligoendopeptidase F